MPRKATPDDYLKIQGGIPEIRQEKGGLWSISHNYNQRDPLVVRTHISPEARGTVVIDDVEFQISLLRRFEGDPCEETSFQAGGRGYERKG